MDIQKAELLRGVSNDFVKAIQAITTKENHEQGIIIFQVGDPASYLYILLMGKVKLIIGERGHVIHTVSRPGEAFGWSSIVGREVYSATAECIAPTTLHKIDRGKLLAIMQKDVASGFIFYQRLASILGSRLLLSYKRYEKVFNGNTLI